MARIDSGKFMIDNRKIKIMKKNDDITFYTCRYIFKLSVDEIWDFIGMPRINVLKKDRNN